MYNLLTERTYQLLKKKYKYFGEIETDVSEAVEILEMRGYKVMDNFKEFYSKFGETMHCVQRKGQKDWLDFDIYHSVDTEHNYDDEIINYYPKFIGCNNLIIVGNINDNIVIVMDENSKFYLLHWNCVSELGNIGEALDLLLFGCYEDHKWKCDKEWWDNQKINYTIVSANQMENRKRMIERFGERD